MTKKVWFYDLEILQKNQKMNRESKNQSYTKLEQVRTIIK